MTQVYWLSLLIKEPEMQKRFGPHVPICNCLRGIPVDERSSRGPFAVFLDSREKMEPITKGSYGDVRTYLKTVVS